MQKRIDRVNGELAKYETIKKFVLIEQPLTVENGLLTATLKPKRKQIVARFQREIDALYEARS